MMTWSFTIVTIIALLYTASVQGKCQSMVDLEKNMPQWVDVVPYSHLKNLTWGYPTDCSGFVSWALQTTKPLDAYEFASDKYSTSINIDDLEYGDVITHVMCDSTKDYENEGISIYGKIPEVSGHVFFFDKWNDDEHSYFWAYESTETQDQTEACLAQKGLMVRSECFNHYVKKSRSKPEKWMKDNCTSASYGWVTGGPKRLSSDLLCR